MRTPALLVLAASVAAISCTVSSDGLSVTPNGDAGASGRAAPDPTGFKGVAGDAGGPDVASHADAAPAAPAPPVAVPDASPPPPPPRDASPPPPPPVGPRVLRLHDLKVGRLVAGVVHAHQLDAEAGSAGLVLPPDPDALLKLQLGTQDLEAAELTVDVLFAHDIKAGRVQIGTTHARVKMKGRERGRD
jgi:hypothetical protein